MSEVLFASVAYSRYDENLTLPAKFERLLEKSGLSDKVRNKKIAIKIHVGCGTGYTTIPPIFIIKLVDFIHKYGGECFVTDHYVHHRHPERRGYTESALGCPVLDDCGFFGKYFYTEKVNYRDLQHIDIAGLIHDADFLIDFSHFKGHGCCAYGGATKNIAMGCVTDRTRREIHSLEGGLVWDESKCIHCGKCINACNHHANSFDEDAKYKVNFHNCTNCTHCVKVCPTGAITLDSHDYRDFQYGMALCTKTVLDTFKPGNTYFINVLTSITALCDCWGLTTPALVPDIGIMAGEDIVSVEQASLDAVKFENLIEVGVPQGMQLGNHGHLFERLHGKDPYIQPLCLEKVGLGSISYQLTEIK